MSLFNRTLDHLVWMAKQDGAKAHACHRALVLESDESGLWPEIAKKLLERVPSVAETMRNESKRLNRATNTNSAG